MVYTLRHDNVMKRAYFVSLLCSMPGFGSPIRCCEFESVCVEVNTDGSGDGIALPFPTSHAYVPSWV